MKSGWSSPDDTLTTSLASSLHFLPLFQSLAPSISTSIHLSLSLSLCLTFSPVLPWRTAGLWRSCPSGRKRASPSLLLFFHNLLFMSDRPPPDKWLPYGERKAEDKEGRKESLCVLFLSGLVNFYSGVFEISISFGQRFMSCVNIPCWMASCPVVPTL